MDRAAALARRPDQPLPGGADAPAGFGPIYNQNFTLCPADPAGFVVTPMQSIWASGL